MALDFKDYSLTVTNIYDAGVFPRAHQNTRSGGGELAQCQFAMFITTVLTPHHGKHTELRQVGGTLKLCEHSLPLVLLQPHTLGSLLVLQL